jgi:hypothetical protein
MPDGNFTVRLISCHKIVFEMNKLFMTKNRFAFHRKFFISAKLVHGIADNSEHIIITIGRRQTAFAEKRVSLV